VIWQFNRLQLHLHMRTHSAPISLCSLAVSLSSPVLTNLAAVAKPLQRRVA
jgi:hypothetical protein